MAKYSISDILAITVRRYLQSPNDRLFWKAYQGLPDKNGTMVLSLIREHFDISEFIRNPMLIDDTFLYDYINNINLDNQVFPKDDLIRQYEKINFTPDDNDFFNRVILENRITVLEKENQDLKSLQVEELIVSQNLANRDYKKLSFLGGGGFGNVYLAEHAISKEKFAIKCLKTPSDNNQEDILREITNLARLNHPNIIKYFNSFFDDDGNLFMVMEYCPQGSLHDRINKRGRIPLEELTTMFLKLTNTLKLLHENGIIHHDIKPPNILIDRNNELKISDFGCVNTTVGTSSYYDPGFYDGNPFEQEERSDIFSLGVTLLECAMGRNPFWGVSEQERMRMLNSADLPINDLPFWLKEIILKSIQVNPELRFQTMEEFYETFVNKNIPKLLNYNLMKLEKDASTLKFLIGRKKWIKAGQLIRNHPDLDTNLNLLIYSGQYYLSIHQIAKAKVQFQKALKTNPYTRVEKQIAEIYLQTGEISKATSLLLTYINRNFNDIEAHNQLLHAYFLSGRWDLGYDQALILHNSFPEELIFENNLTVFDCLIHGDPINIWSLKRKNPFTFYNFQLITDNEPASWIKGGKPELKSKLIFQQYRFRNIEKSKNTLIVIINDSVFESDDHIVTFGRKGFNYNTFCDFEGTAVSRRHFLIVNMKDNVWLYDLDSTGVYVDGVKVRKKCFLLGLHKIRFGSYEISVKTSNDILM